MSILPEHPSLCPFFNGVRVARSLVFCVMFCRSLFVLLSFFFWPLFFLSFLDLRTLITPFRDRPFNLKGRLWFFVSFRIFFSDSTRIRIFFCRVKHGIFFQNSTLAYMTKTLYQIFFSSTNIRLFFSATLGIRIYFFRKNNNPLQVKWSFPYPYCRNFF